MVNNFISFIKAYFKLNTFWYFKYLKKSIITFVRVQRGIKNQDFVYLIPFYRTKIEIFQLKAILLPCSTKRMLSMHKSAA